MSRRLLPFAVALAATAVAVGIGVVLTGDDGGEGGAGGEPSAPAPTVPSVALTDYDTRTVAVQRAEFCEAVPAEAVERALGAPSTDEVSYRDGQPAQVTARVRDVAHEYGCEWSAGPARARAWVFAPPVTPDRAADLVVAARRGDGCRPAADAPAFGTASVALVCRDGRRSETSFRGLFGDAWLTCSVTGGLTGGRDRASALDEAGRWCVAVAEAASRGGGSGEVDESGG